MKNTALEEIRALLPLLDDKDLQQVSLLVAALRTNLDKSNDSIIWYNALSKTLVSNVDWRTPPFNTLKPDTQRKIRTTYYDLLAWFDQVFEPPLTKIETHWALFWCADLLGTSLLNQDRPLCMNTLLNAAPEIPWIIDYSFPGYIKNSCLRWVISAGANKNN